MKFFQHLPFRSRQPGNLPVQEQRGEIEEFLTGGGFPDHDVGSDFFQLGRFLAGQFSLAVEDDRQGAPGGGRPDLLKEFHTGEVGHPRIQHHAIEAGVVLQNCGRFLSAGGGGDLDVFIANQLDGAMAMRGVLRNDKQIPDAAVDKFLGVVQRFDDVLPSDRFFQIVDGAQAQAAKAIVLGADDVHRDMTCGGIVFQTVKHAPAGGIRQPQVQKDGRRPMLARERQGLLGAAGDQGLKPLFPRQIEQDAGEVGIILDDQEDLVPRLNRGAVVVQSRGFVRLGHGLRGQHFQTG